MFSMVEHLGSNPRALLKGSSSLYLNAFWRASRTAGEEKILHVLELIRRLLLHVLPDVFQRIRATTGWWPIAAAKPSSNPDLLLR